MKKVLFVSLVLALVFVLFVPQAVAKKKPAEVVKVNVCHVIAANDVVPFGSNLLYFGKELSISENALEDHLLHGDFDSFWGGDEAAGPINLFREAGVKLPAANCYFREDANGVFHGPLD